MRVKSFKTIQDVWSAVDKGLPVYWSNDAYQLTIEDAKVGTSECREYWLNHFTFRDGKLLRVTCTSNWFGSLLNESDLSRLYTK